MTEAALGILTVVNANMANAIWSRTAQRGIDPRDYTLVAFGGAGPLHGAEVARQLGIREVLDPAASRDHLGHGAADHRSAIRHRADLLSGLDRAGRGRGWPTISPRCNSEIVAPLRRRQDRYRIGSVSNARVICVMPARAMSCACRSATGRSTMKNCDRTFERFHVQHRAEYGHAFRDSVDRDRQHPPGRGRGACPSSRPGRSARADAVPPT